MTRSQWLMEQVRDLPSTDFADFRRRFIDYDTDHAVADPTPARARARLDPEVVEALAAYRREGHATTP
jgi:hypothetical protein